jgi:hypothetical protein
MNSERTVDGEAVEALAEALRKSPYAFGTAAVSLDTFAAVLYEDWRTLTKQSIPDERLREALDDDFFVDIIEQAIFDTGTGLEAALLADQRIRLRLSGEPNEQ